MGLIWALAKPLVFRHWPILLALVSVYAFYKYETHRAYNQGRAAVIAEQQAESARRSKDAEAADKSSRACAADSTCRMSDDGFRRD